MSKEKKKSIFNIDLKNLKNIVKSKKFKEASKDLVKTLKDARDTMDVFKN